MAEVAHVVALMTESHENIASLVDAGIAHRLAQVRCGCDQRRARSLSLQSCRMSHGVEASSQPEPFPKYVSVPAAPIDLN